MIKINGQEANIIRFPDKTPLIRQETITGEAYTIEWLYDDDSELFALTCLTEHLREHGAVRLELKMPYIPNARFDRVNDDDEVFTLKWFAKTINACGFDSVEVLDPHSPVSCALIDNVKTVEPIQYIKSAIADIRNVIGNARTDEIMIFFPDEGALKRYGQIARALIDDNKNARLCFGMKTRDWRTGEIYGLRVLPAQNDGGSWNLEGKDVLIIDDICSRGGTFHYAAKELRKLGANEIFLYVSHCEQSVMEGAMYTEKSVRRVYTTNSIWRSDDETDGFVQVVEPKR